MLVTLVAGMVGTTFGLVRAQQARRAEAARAEGERQAKRQAEEREAETTAVLDFIETFHSIHFAARTIASIAALIGLGSTGQASTITPKSASAGIGGETATDAFAAPAVKTSAISPESAGF